MGNLFSRVGSLNDSGSDFVKVGMIRFDGGKFGQTSKLFAFAFKPLSKFTLIVQNDLGLGANL